MSTETSDVQPAKLRAPIEVTPSGIAGRLNPEASIYCGFPVYGFPVLTIANPEKDLAEGFATGRRVARSLSAQHPQGDGEAQGLEGFALAGSPAAQV